MLILEYLAQFGAGAWDVLATMAPYLLFGFLIAGGLSVFVSPSWVERHLGGRGALPIVKSVLFGIPLPLCSCGVIPVTASIRNHGASRGATVGFLLATPQTGVDSILATWGMLGPVMGVFRPLAALITGLLGGGLVAAVDKELPASEGGDSPECTEACCSGDTSHGKLYRALHYGLVTLPADIGKALLIGVAVAALVATFAPRDALVTYLGGGVLAMAAMMLIGIPIYVCSTASIPIAVGFMHLGASPGAALAFLIAGPATNAATIAMTWKVLGKRTAFIYLGTVAAGAMLSGLALDAVAGTLGGLGLSPMDHSAHEMGLTWFNHLAGAALIAVLANSLWPRRHGAHKPHCDAEQTITLSVSGMTCSHCSGTVAHALRETPGVESAEVDLDEGKATVKGVGLSPDSLSDKVSALGYGANVLAQEHQH